MFFCFYFYDNCDRFDEELEQIKLKNSIGGKNKRNQHTSRLGKNKFKTSM